MMIKATFLMTIMLLESAYMIGLKTDVVHRDNFRELQRMTTMYGPDKWCVLESANMHPDQNEKILASNDERMRGYKRVDTIRKDMTYLLVYEKE